MKQIDSLKNYYQALSQRDQKLVFTISIIIGLTLFYTIIWEPIHINNKIQTLEQEVQTKNHDWMQQAATEVKTLKESGATSAAPLSSNTPVSILVEQTAKTAGINQSIGKIESAGKNSANAILNQASFDQMLIWINTIKTKYNISVLTAKIERTNKEGIVNARLSFSRK